MIFSFTDSRSKLAILAGFLTVGALLAHSPAPAQEAPEAEAPSETAAEPESEITRPDSPTVALPDVPLRAEEALLTLREIESRLKEDTKVDRIARELEEAADQLRGLPRPWEEEGFPASIRTLTDVRREWDRVSDRVAEWQASLQARAQAIGAEQAILRATRDLWSETAAATEAQDPEYFVAVEQRIQDVLERTSGLRRLAREQLEPVLLLQERLSRAVLEVEDGLRKLDEHMSHAREQMFLPERAPLWTLRAWRPDERTLGAQIRDSWREHRTTLADYWDDYRRQLLAHLGLFLLTLGFFCWLYWRSRRWKIDEPELEASAFILGRPLATTILLTLLLSLWILPNAPRSLIQLIVLALFVPLIRLLPGLLPPESRQAIYVLIGLFVVERIEEMAGEGSILSRVLLLLLTIVTLTLMTWVVRKEKTLGIDRVWWKGVRFLGRLAPALLAISLVANVIGVVNLSDLLTSGLLRGAFLALVLLAGDKVIDALLIALLRSPAARRLRSVRTHPELLHRRTMAIVQVLLFVLWLWGTLAIFTILDPTWALLVGVLSSPLTVGAFSISLGDVLAFFLAVWLATQISRFLRFVLEEDVFPKTTVPRGTQSAFSSLIHYTLITLGLLAGLAASGIEMTRITVILGALGVGIGFGLQNIVNNFISGLILIFERPVQVGDTVEFNEILGRVRRIGIRSSTVRTYRGAEMIVPNADLVSNMVTNWTLSDQLRRIDVPVGVKYGTDPEKVIEVLHEAAMKVDRVMQEPEPQVLFDGFGDSSLNFLVRVWISSFDEGVRMKSAVAVAVNAALREADMEIPFPQRDLHLRSVDPAAGGRLRGEETPPSRDPARDAAGGGPDTGEAGEKD
jgi:small-conductance mechanosensitive channel